jgi:hypothetical protein
LHANSLLEGVVEDVVYIILKIVKAKINVFATLDQLYVTVIWVSESHVQLFDSGALLARFRLNNRLKIEFKELTFVLI